MRPILCGSGVGEGVGEGTCGGGIDAEVPSCRSDDGVTGSRARQQITISDSRKERKRRHCKHECRNDHMAPQRKSEEAQLHDQTIKRSYCRTPSQI